MSEGAEASLDEGGEGALPQGNPVRVWGLLLAVLGAAGGVAVMASGLSARVAVPLGIGAVLATVLGALGGIGSFDDEASPLPAGCAAPLWGVIAGLGGWVLGLRVAVAGWVAAPLDAVLVTAPFLVALFAGDRLWRRLEGREDEPLGERWGLWLLVLAALLYLPTLGDHSLSDPWETHYGEVSREILARGDWTSLWWAQDGWFFSKPVLTFWLQALGMALLGVRYEPGQMLAGVGEGFAPQPAWALRAPVFLLVLLGVGLLYRGVARGYGRRAAFFGGVLRSAAPQFALLARQTMTDMPFVAAMAAAVGLVMLAMSTPPDERVRAVAVAPGLTFSLFHVVVGGYLVVVLPQVLYLLSQHVAEVWPLRFASETFAAGSPNNCTLPGNPACELGLTPKVSRFPAGIQALLWGQCAALVLWLSWGERRKQRLLMMAAWLMVSLSTMAKGPAGLGLPVLATLGFVIASRRWRDLLRMEILAGTLIFASAALPWIVTMYVRHGSAFTDRLLFHDMFKRVFRHVHDTNTGVDTSFRYYLWQLGYAVFPWVGLAPFAALRWVRGEGRPERRMVDLLLGSWLLVAFVLFSTMGTKFHHYALPMVPPLAMLTGRLLADLEIEQSKAKQVMFGAMALFAAGLVLTVGRDLAFDLPGRHSTQRFVNLITYKYNRPFPKGLGFSGTFWAFAGLGAMAMLAMVQARWRRHAVAALCAVTMASGCWVVNGYLIDIAPHYGQRGLLARYEQVRSAQPGPLVAYQMNWKGENFYRGNELAIFVATGKAFQAWVAKQRAAGQATFYFLTEPKRVPSLHRELGRPRDFAELTDEGDHNKFLLVRARF